MKEIFQLAKEIETLSASLIKDYDKNIVTKDFERGCTIIAQLILEKMESIFEVNLKDYYIKY